MKLTDKKFKHYVKKIMLDYQAVGIGIKGIENLLKTHCTQLSIVNIFCLVDIIYETKNEMPTNLIEQEIFQEHKYMREYLEQYFIIEMICSGSAVSIFKRHL